MKASVSRLLILSSLAAAPGIQPAAADILNYDPPGTTIAGTLVVPIGPQTSDGDGLFPAPKTVRIGGATIGGPDTIFSSIGGVVFGSDGSTPGMVGGRAVGCRRVGGAVACD